jgi:ribosomal protein S18 acetylase RimI-like enzyme
VGALLLKAAVAHAQSAQAVLMSLTTNVANKTAQAVYEAQGWEREQAFLTYNFNIVSRRQSFLADSFTKLKHWVRFSGRGSFTSFSFFRKSAKL